VAGAVEEDATKAEAGLIAQLEAGQALPMLQGPLGQADQAVTPTGLTGRLDTDLLRRDG